LVVTSSLEGIRALVTRPLAQNAELCAAIRAAGGRAIGLPLLRIEPVSSPGGAEQAHHMLADSDLAIFVSANAVRHALAGLRAGGYDWPVALRCLAIGTATRRALDEAGVAAHAGRMAMDSEELIAHELLEQPAGLRVVLVKGEGGRALIATQLRERGAELTEWVVYRRCPEAVDARAFGTLLHEHGINVLLAANGETLELLLGLLARVGAGTIPPDTPIVVPGERVAGIASRAGYPCVEVAANATDTAMLAALAEIAARMRPAVEH
jgi:uroporphyrinogen-III synthase